MSLVTLFQVYTVVQVIVLWQVGLYTGGRLAESLLSLVPMMLIQPLGARYASRVSQRTFDR